MKVVEKIIITTYSSCLMFKAFQFDILVKLSLISDLGAYFNYLHLQANK